MKTIAAILPRRRFVSRPDPVILAFVVVLLLLALADPALAQHSLLSVAENVVRIAPFLLGSVLLTACANASGSDALIGRVFRGRAVFVIAAAALAGALSPFCSCGVIPLIAALLVMGVPLYAVMPFWLASPLMDPAMFVLTAGSLGWDFALFKTAAAVATGLLGGVAAWSARRYVGMAPVLREGIGDGGCATAAARPHGTVVWKFWREDQRRLMFSKSALRTAAFLLKWLALAYLLESVLVRYLPAELVVQAVGHGGARSILAATLIGVPAYLNGYAALPLVAGLIEQGMNPGAGMAFLLAGGVTSIPAALAVFALVRWRVFAIYLAVALVSAFVLGLVFAWLA